jgi:non-specific serine/threonine protein kinase/serine/threonine-protein kinase
MMDHRAIARVFDAGTTPQGRPYFAMEYIQGVPITEHCDRLKLSNRERLELFIQVCEGVQHAHQKAVIHRDLKPSNVLVTVQDSGAVPKIIDFGVAKAISLRLTEKTMFTELGALIGTPEYMSPEQAQTTGQDVDTRTDVYSLGVLLYELLVGALPFDPQELRSGGYAGIVQRLREDEPPRPSVRLSTLGERSTDSARKRSVDLRTLRSQLRGDLDWIAMKALEKDRSRRYDSPAEFAADVRRHLNNEPVLAGAPTAAYRAAKFVRRHRVGVGVSALVVFGLVAFAVTMGVQAKKIAAERDRADRERENLEKVSAFLASTLSSVKPKDLGAALWKNLHDSVAETRRKGGGTPASVDAALKSLDASLAGVNATGVALTVLDEQILARAGQTIEKSLAQQPLVAGRLEYTLGDTYRKLGLNDQAERHMSRSLDIRKAGQGPEVRDTLDSQNGLAAVYIGQGRYAEAEAILKTTCGTRRRVFGPDDPDTISCIQNLAAPAFQQGRYAEAEAFWKEALERGRRVLGPDDPTVVKTLGNLAACTLAQGHYEEALPLLEASVATRRRLFGPEDPETLVAMGNLGSVYGALGRHADAERVFQETYDLERRVLGPTHSYTLATMSNLAVENENQDHWSDAVTLLTENLELQRRAHGDAHPETLNTLKLLARAEGKLGRSREAEAHFAKAIEGQRTAIGLDHPNAVETLFYMSLFAAESGDKKRALDLLTQAVDHGKPEADEIAQAPELKSLRGDPAFEAQVARARENAAKKP